MDPTPPIAPDDVRLAVVRALCDEVRAAPERARLTDLARRAGYSVAQIKRLFDELLGVSPARFAEACRAEALRRELRATDSVTLAIYAAGYSAPSRVYEAPILGMTPAQFARGGTGQEIAFTVGESALGRLLLAGTERGVCAVDFGEDRAELQARLRAEFPRSRVTEAADRPALRLWMAALDEHLRGRRPHPALPLDVRTTAFRHRVYRALAAIPLGQTRTYREVAESIGQPTAARAVARACATNRVAVLIPCHRVLRGDGDLAGYRWGLDRKRALLDCERRARGV